MKERRFSSVMSKYERDICLVNAESTNNNGGNLIS